VYGPTAEQHLKQPRNLGRIEQPDGVGHVEEPATDTQVTVYVRLGTNLDGVRMVQEARFRAFGCGGCIIGGSVATELVTGRTVASAVDLDAKAILHALDDGLPADQRYCAELVARALQLALTDAGL
jgi:nitrogen fixation NifU-like protein